MDHNEISVDSVVAASIRHHWSDRLFHWLMAITTLILLFSAFLPIVGIDFDWVPWHWITGVALSILILLHIIRALFFQGLRTMLPGADDVRQVLSSSDTSASYKPSKYDSYQKSYHWAVALTMLALIGSGIPMLIKLDTVFWDRNPGILSDIQWGYVYVTHGFAALGLIFLVLLHIYFSLLPEHKLLLVSMISGRGPQHVRGEEQ